MSVVWFVIGLVCGSLALWLVLRGRERGEAARTETLERQLASAEVERAASTERLGAAEREVVALSTAIDLERQNAAEKIETLERARSELGDSFKVLSNEALAKNNKAFLELAQGTLSTYREQTTADLDQRRVAVEHLVKPIRESLEKVDTKIRSLEESRRQAYGALTEQVKLLAESQEHLRSETSNLVTALRAPAVRGRWGEMQLRRVVETAGMLEHCDFVEQATVTTEDGTLRPDMIVKLPGGKQVVVDAKTPLSAYLEAAEASDEDVKTDRLRDHARQLGDHVSKLSAKAYWEQFDAAPDFVILFVPGEPIFSEALRHDPALIENAARQQVFIATPITLISLLRAVAYGWQQETVAEGAREVSRLGRELHERLATMGEHLAKLGRSIDGAVQSYNGAIGSLERRVLVSARRLADHGAASSKELSDLPQVDRAIQRLQATEFAVRSVDDEQAGSSRLTDSNDAEGLDDASTGDRQPRPTQDGA